MKIHFCDLCNESVPQGDLDRGRAVMRKGRVICSTCERLMSGEPEAGASGASPASTPPTAPEPEVGAGSVPIAAAATASAAARPEAPLRAPVSRAGAGAALFIATLTLFGLVGATYYLHGLIAGNRDGLRETLVDARLQADRDGREREKRLERRLTELTDRLSSSSRAATEVATRIDEASKHQRDALAEVRQELRGVGERLRALEPTKEAVARHERDLTQVADSLAGFHAELLRIADHLLEARAAEPEPWREEAAATEEEKPAWWPLLGELSSANSGGRWQAVQALGDTQDPAVAEYLAPLLADPDIFVRMATARILGDLRAVRAIGALIGALEDPEPSVREAAVVSLRAITGRDLRFDPDGREGERIKQVKAWRDWWRRAEKDLLSDESPRS